MNQYGLSSRMQPPPVSNHLGLTFGWSLTEGLTVDMIKNDFKNCILSYLLKFDNKKFIYILSCYSKHTNLLHKTLLNSCLFISGQSGAFINFWCGIFTFNNRKR